MKTQLTLPIGAILMSAGLASAQSFSYSAQDADHNSVIDPGAISYQSSIAFIDQFNLLYDSGSQQLQASVTYTPNGAVPDGFWFVVSDGPDPKDDVNEYAIFYLDNTQPSTVLTSYVYNGANSGSSWETPGNLLASSLNAGSGLSASSFTNGGQTTFQFSADVSQINNAANFPASYNLGADWDGAQFGEQVGIWFHTFTLEGKSEYNDDGSLKKLDFKHTNFFDVADQDTVPEPSTLFLGVAAAAGLLVRRKR